MNERIVQLADQARLAANAEYEKWTPTEDFSGVPHIRNIFMDKFAELIVRECADIADEMSEICCPYPGDAMVERFGFGEADGAATWRCNK